MRVAACLAIAVPVAAAVDFQRDIRPILSDKCFACHGPDEAARKANLRLDVESDSRRAVTPGNAAASKLIQRVTSSSKALRMPPLYAGAEPLPANQIALLREWIGQGARYETHWAFRAPARPPLPSVSNRAWARTPVDAFALARLDREKLTPSGEAPRAILLRRAALDITGLPPTLAELDAFLADRSPRAYEAAVDRLLDSPGFGERMASDWLDGARYADTHGYQVDPQKEMWAWRDWVIRAFNANMPFDRFTVEQIAGDLLPNATLDQRIASGFHRNHRINTEAGSIAEEFHVENIVDRVATTGTVWLGLTIGCARCHDHKYDPISMRDFYSMFAMFNGVQEVGTGGRRDGRGNAEPFLELPDPEAQARLAEIDEKIKARKKALAALEASLPDPPAELPAARWETIRPAKIQAANGSAFTVLEDGSALAGGAHPERDVYTIEADVSLDKATAFRVELLPDPSLPDGCSGRGAKGRSALTVFEAKLNGKTVDLSKATASFATEDSFLDRVIRPQPQIQRGWSVGAKCGEPQHLILETTRMTGDGKSARLTIRLGNEHGDGWLMGRFRVSVTQSEWPVRPAEMDRKFRVRGLRAYRAENEELAAMQTRRTAIANRIPSTMVMSEMASPRDSFVLMRGAYDKPADKVAPGVPAAILPLPQGAPANRLGLARWLVDPAHPLTARVAVNRIWQQMFGTGLVRTSEDFGLQGEPPSHPELLDWLAVEFVRTGWDVKAMVRLIASSAVYRQRSNSTPALLDRDPENRLLARGPRFRLPAETIRDSALTAAGLIRHREGGAPVKPYQPAGTWDYVALQQGAYVRSKGGDLYRRSLYTYWKRTIPPPGLMTFDAPTREFCVVRRSRSSTPMQALALLNDETYVEAARALAQRMILDGGAAPRTRLAHGFRVATSRVAERREIEVLLAGLERRLTHYRAHPKEAAELLAAGESPRDPSLDAAELAAYATAASVILNLDEVVTKQ